MFPGFFRRLRSAKICCLSRSKKTKWAFLFRLSGDVVGEAVLPESGGFVHHTWIETRSTWLELGLVVPKPEVDKEFLCPESLHEGRIEVDLTDAGPLTLQAQVGNAHKADTLSRQAFEVPVVWIHLPIEGLEHVFTGEDAELSGHQNGNASILHLKGTVVHQIPIGAVELHWLEEEVLQPLIALVHDLVELGVFWLAARSKRDPVVFNNGDGSGGAYHSAFFHLDGAASKALEKDLVQGYDPEQLASYTVEARIVMASVLIDQGSVRSPSEGDHVDFDVLGIALLGRVHESFRHVDGFKVNRSYPSKRKSPPRRRKQLPVLLP